MKNTYLLSLCRNRPLNFVFKHLRGPVKNYRSDEKNITLATLTIRMLFLTCSTLSMICSANASENVISLRIKGMQKAEENMFAIKKGIEREDFQEIGIKAQDIQNWANLMLTYFPSGSAASVNNSSAASNNIWEELDLFRALIETKNANAKKMVLASRERNLEILARAFKATRKTCNVCHERFRN